MVDSYFFWVDQNCPRSKNTGVMEPEKLFWDAVIADETADKVGSLRRKTAQRFN